MKKLIFVPIILLFSLCTKKVGVSNVSGLNEVSDTTSAKISFKLNDTEITTFKNKGMKIDNKLVMTGFKSELLEGIPVSFHHFTICFDQNTDKQRLHIINYISRFGDATKPWATFNTSQDDGGVVCEVFDVNKNDSLNNWIQITRHENNFSEIWGDFSVSFFKTEACKTGFYPDKLIIRNGYFHVVIK